MQKRKTTKQKKKQIRKKNKIPLPKATQKQNKNKQTNEKANKYIARFKFIPFQL